MSIVSSNNCYYISTYVIIEKRKLRGGMMLNREFLSLLDNLFEGAYIVDMNRKILYWNEGAKKITGYNRNEVVNFHCFNNILRHVDEEGNELCFSGCPLQKTLLTGDAQENHVYLHHKKGHRVPVVVRTKPLYNEQGDIEGALEVFTDSRYRMSLYHENQRLQELTIRDALTNVYNRSYLNYQLEAFVKEFQLFNQPFGVVFVDIDNFKNVNDVYGHQIGDEILKLVARTINSNIRSDDVFGRYGGEEFLLILKLSNEEELLKVSDKVRVLVSNSSIIVEGVKLKVTISLGATLYHQNETIESVVNRADKAMYQSKQTGKNKVTLG